MNEDFVSYEIAQTLKKVGFDWPTYGYYHKGNCADDEVWYYTMNPADDHNHRNNPRVWSAPTLAQAQKWLREIHGISVEPHCCTSRVWFVNVCYITKLGGDICSAAEYDTYESALSAGLECALKLIEEGEV